MPVKSYSMKSKWMASAGGTGDKYEAWFLLSAVKFPLRRSPSVTLLSWWENYFVFIWKRSHSNHPLSEKVQISLTKAVETILQLLQNQESYKKDQTEKSVISHFQSLRQTYFIWQNVEFTLCWHFPLSPFVASYCAQSTEISYFDKTGNIWKNNLELY